MTDSVEVPAPVRAPDAAATRAGSAGTRAPTPARRDVQAMRALAVGGVVLNHLWPGWLTGGYVGVDVFFVISGYLISLHLLRELADTGRIGLVAFYSRRARRLLPAALLVVVVSLVAMVLFVPSTVWDRNVGEAIASTLYVENFQLVRLAVDYQAHDEAASAFQHYWSLSVEEQFYLVWPALFLGFVALRRWRRRGNDRSHGLAAVGAGVGVIVLASGVAAVVQTAASPTAAYFLTWTRAWEFGIGALVAVLARSRGGRPVLSTSSAGALAVGGWLLMAGAMVVFDGRTAVPGAPALVPVLGAAAVLVAGESRLRAPLDPITSVRPVQFLGDISYSVYLWHWPLLVLLPYAVGSHGLAARLAVLALTLLLAWLTRRYVEQAAQRSGFLKAGRLRSLASTAVAMAVVVGLASGVSVESARRADAVRADLISAVTHGVCVGAGALERECGDPYQRPLIAPVSDVDKDFHNVAGCRDDASMVVAGWKPRTDCDFSGGDAKALHVWLVGDSHAQHLVPALAEAGRRHHWKVTSLAIGGCLPIPTKQAPGAIEGRSEDVCPHFGPAVDTAVTRERPDVVIVSVSSKREHIDDGTGRPQVQQYVDALSPVVTAWTRQGSVVLAMTDNPGRTGVLDSTCTNQNLDHLETCSVARSSVVRLGAFERATDTLAGRVRGLARIDLTDHVCDARTCRSVVGGVNVLHDTNHYSAVYSRSLGRFLAQDVLSAVTDHPVR
ncbi:acyltransferase family protein [Phycicoccus sp. Root101]|uniref:acyltransferase family protein n=1 Tax=Phycicoccus sp. Root101 TaxID=1736421 RepID=UPI00070312E5|nr:acyltransferase family protein [Phycicoccus sp. Root101]KQU68735.1 hypothetical protein ASC58_08520 [Phycicoccus sp. Root101]